MAKKGLRRSILGITGIAAVAAYLTQTEHGKKTRKHVVDYGKEFAENPKEKGAEVLEQAKEFGKKTSKHVVDYGKEFAENPKEKGTEALEHVKDFGKKTADRAVDLKDKVTSGEITVNTVVESGKEKAGRVKDKTAHLYGVVKDEMTEKTSGGFFKKLRDKFRKQEIETQHSIKEPITLSDVPDATTTQVDSEKTEES